MKISLTLEEGEEIRTAEDLFAYLREMHIEEWRPSYDTNRFGYIVCDGTQWELQFEYGNGQRPWASSGSNSYPYNFVELLKLFGEEDPEAEIEDDEAEEEEKEYLYCQVTPEDINRSYSYISEIPDTLPGDLVVIPYGADNKEKFGTVVSTGIYDEWTAPYPVEYTKKILRKADDEEIRRFKERDIEKYVYCWVVPEGKSDGYYYISEIEDLQKGDHVIIPFGPENHEIYGKVSSIKRVSEKNAPFPPDRTKKILRKVEPDNTLHEFLTVLPITHKQNTFGYINTLPDVQVGDYVEIRFRDGIRVAQVKAKSTGTIDQAPNNFMGTMEVRRKLNYENCDYIRFQAELLPLALTGELFRKDSECPSVPHRNPRLTEKAVTAFEKVYQIQLPEEYRTFVTEISNGLDHVAGLNVIDYQEEYTWLKNPFRFDDLIDRAEEYKADSPELEYECDDRDCTECEFKDVCPDSETFDNFGYIDLPFFDGTLSIYSSGDTSDRMIVNGKHAGAVIRFDQYMGRRTLLSKSFKEYVQSYIGKV